MGANVPVQLPEGETLTDDGTLSFASGDTLTLGAGCCSAAEIVVAGTLTAAGTTFTGTGSSGTIVVNSGGQLNATSTTFSVNQACRGKRFNRQPSIRDVRHPARRQ